ncbi:MAG: tRNA 4-thiouridine(8) synthase ThiI [Coriobacteriaceae bacterium]|nr:tRNA 4-thiouridine(8) synthase ThiI [Coriobacteriaceae bacterium]MDD7112497.1 tRNA 4-thiouridine(8) synthase ThiI [Coriobacteriaceae bacterium]MDY5809506.1 tRNA uracil 4-sulfurtransferase ThiI [Coriobacteriales bacterium]
MAAFVCLVHYHEIGLKGNNRSTFEHKLIDNLRATLKGLPVSSVERISGHLLVRLAPAADYDAAMTVYGRIRQTPGVARVSFARCCEVSSEQYCEAAYLELAASGDFESFKVDSRRSNTNIALNSLDLNREVGSYLCERFPDKVVRMKGQDRTVHVYVIQGSVYVYVKTDEGVGGLPVGSAGKVISLLSSGIDSPVASWRMLRRGAIVVGLHFSGRPQTSDTSEWLVQDIIEKLSPAGGFGRLYVVPFGDIQRRIARAVPDDLRIIMYRRMMFSFACRLSAIEHAKALVTGESLGQVASQTLENIMAVDEMSTIPVFRPLIGSDKREIMAEAERLGTLEISNQKAADCCTLFMPRSPETHVRLSEAHEVWDSFDHEAMLDEMMDLLEYRSFNCPSYVAPKQFHEIHPELAPALRL